MLDSIAKAMATIAQSNNGIYPSHEQFMTDMVLRKKFAEILTTYLLESGNIEITELNTGAKGFKVGEEARLFGMPLEDFLNVQGLSSTTSS